VLRVRCNVIMGRCNMMREWGIVMRGRCNVIGDGAM